jgi:hypothetical protein
MMVLNIVDLLEVVELISLRPNLFWFRQLSGGINREAVDTSA